MPFPPNDPAYQYTDPITWHEDPIYKTEGPSGTYTNHTLDVSSTVTLLSSAGSAHGDGLFGEAPGGPYPGEDATQCAWGKAARGQDVGGVGVTWGGTCPALGSDGGTGGVDGSVFDTSTTGLPTGNPSLPDQSTASANICGFALRPWKLRTWDNPYLDDATLEDEYNDATSLTWPGPGWFLQNEGYYPFILGIDFAPDELTTPGTKTEPVNWYYDPTGWGLDGLVPTSTPVWTGRGSGATGTILTTYAGGLADWESLPAAWMPTQDTSEIFFAGGFIEPEDDYAALIPLSLAADTLYGTPGYPGPNEVGGRMYQRLVFRVAWRAPQFRWYKERDTVVRQWPRDDAQGASSAPRQWPPSKTYRQFGGYPGGSRA